VGRQPRLTCLPMTPSTGPGAGLEIMEPHLPAMAAVRGHLEVPYARQSSGHCAT